MIVVDASVAVRWYAEDAWTDLANGLLTPEKPLSAPDLIVPELSNALWKLARAGIIADGQAADALARIPSVVSLVPTANLGARAFAIARTLNHPTYDCFYLALAEAAESPLVTLDRRLFSRTRGTPWADLTTLLGDDSVLT